MTEVVNAFIASHAKGTAFGNMLMAKYFANAKWLKNSTSEQEMAKLRATVELFQKYGKQYDFDVSLGNSGSQTVTLDVGLKLASMSETVTVTGEPVPAAFTL